MKRQYINLNDIPFPDTIDLERQVVADAVSNPFTIGDVARMVDEGMFSDRDLAGSWVKLLAMYNDGKSIDLATFHASCGEESFSKILPLVGNGTVDSSCIEHGAALFHAASRRRVYFEAVALVQKAATPGLTADDMSAAVEALRDKTAAAAAGNTEVRLSGIFNVMAEEYQRRQEAAKEGIAFICPTGIRRLDRHLNGGWEPGQLVVLAARPSVGKTALMLQMAEAAARAKFPACVFSMEMTNEQLGRRYLIDNKGLMTRREVMTGMTRDEDMFWRRFEEAIVRFQDLPVYVNDTTRDLEELTARISLNARRGRCRVAFVDYLGLIRDDGYGNERLSQQIARVTGTLKQTAKRLGIPVILLCQLNRESAKGNRPPELYDLRDSGAIEQDADIVLMLEQALDEMGKPVISELNSDERMEVNLAQQSGETMLPERPVNVNMWVRKNRVGMKDFAIELRPSLYYSHFEDIATKKEINDNGKN